MSKTLLITGTDTGAGKTVVTTALAAYCLKYRPHSSLGIMKPIQSGEGDRETYQQLFTLNQSAEEMTPLYFQAPLAPPIAAAKENRSIDLGIVWQTLLKLQQRHDLLLVESLGGLGSPVTDELTVADLAGEWRLPTILVVSVRLGAIAQAVANVALARQAKINLRGIILNCTQHYTDEENADLSPSDLIESFTHIPVLGCLPYLPDATNLEELANVGASLDWERLF
ncbi:MAG: ATP-dependent dethiobiotin synthetase BioD [Nostocales cyanobacterium]|nr:MAG: ATP-dependent dethiobiotin synthetase BioD [Nostocales cyanobacterium]TAF07789.1 MAG: ATP-dependent dethiobiotin synthetase BioD [Nostocales cyanobacterium]